MKTVIDIGANIGSFTVFAASMSPEARIISAEPDRSNHTQLEKNISLNSINAKAYQNAVSNKEGTITLYTVTGQSGFGSAYRQAGEANEVACITLERIVQENEIESIDLCKIDCEGAEYDILFSLPDSIWEKIKIIFIEVHAIPGREPQEILSLLQSKKFNIAKTEKHVYLCIKN